MGIKLLSIKNKFVAKCLLLTSTLALSGCDDWVVMSPFGDIAKQEAFLINASTVLMLVIVVPVL
ncbi:MAG: hypothetical protein ABGX64_00425, partial [Cycloclasticus sp.]